MSVSAEAVLKAVRMCGGQLELAQRLNTIQPSVKQGHVWAWIHRYPVPPKHFDGFEVVTAGQVTRHDLRPDLYGKPPLSKSQIARLIIQTQTPPPNPLRRHTDKPQPPHPLRRHTDKPRRKEKAYG